MKLNEILITPIFFHPQFSTQQFWAWHSSVPACLFLFPIMLLGIEIPNQVFWNEIPTLMFRKMIPKLMHCKEIPIRVIRNGFSTAHGRNCPLSIILLPAIGVGCGAYVQSVVDPMWWGWGWAGTQLGNRILMSSKDLVHVMSHLLFKYCR